MAKKKKKKAGSRKAAAQGGPAGKGSASGVKRAKTARAKYTAAKTKTGR